MLPMQVIFSPRGHAVAFLMCVISETAFVSIGNAFGDLRERVKRVF